MRPVMIVNYAFPPFGGAASRRVVKMVRHLGRLGRPCLVVTAPRVINPLIDSSLAHEVPPETPVIRTRSLEPVPPPGKDWPWMLTFRRLINVPLVPNVSVLWAAMAALPALAAAREYKPSAILCSAPEFSSFLVGAFVKRLTGVPLVLDYRDEWSFHPDKEASVKGSVAREAKRDLEAWLERKLLTYADAVIANTEGFKREFIERLGADPARIEVIPNGFDDDDYKGVGSGEVEEHLIVNLGSVDHPSLLPPELFAAMDEAAGRRGVTITLKFIGKTAPELERVIRGLEYERLNLVFTGFMPYAEALAELERASLCLMMVDDAPGRERYHNLKLFDYMRARKPMLVYGPKKSMIAAAAEQSGLGRPMERGDLTGLSSFLDQWLAGSLPSEPNEEFIQTFNWATLAKRLESVLDKIEREHGIFD